MVESWKTVALDTGILPVRIVAPLEVVTSRCGKYLVSLVSK